MITRHRDNVHNAAQRTNRACMAAFQPVYNHPFNADYRAIWRRACREADGAANAWWVAHHYDQFGGGRL